MKTKTSSIILVLLCTVIISTAQIFLKKGANVLDFHIFKLLMNYNLIIGVILYFVGAGLLIIALKNGELSVLYPLIATSYIWVSLLSPLFFNDTMTAIKWFGIAGIVVGVSFIGYGSKQ